MNGKTVKILTYLYIVPLAATVFFNIGNSLLRNTFFDQYSDMETARYGWDRPLQVLVLSLLLFGGICGYMIFCRKMDRLFPARWEQIKQAARYDKSQETVGWPIWIAGIFSAGWMLLFRCRATCDGAALSEIAVQFLQNDFQSLAKGEYLYRYSFQIGFTAFLELVYRIFGAGNYLAVQFFNLAAVIGIVGTLLKITRELFQGREIRRAGQVLYALCLPLFMFVTFIYGDLIGLYFGFLAVYHTILFLKLDLSRKENVKKARRELLQVSLFFLVGILLKSNVNVLLTAVLLLLALHICHQASAPGRKRILWFLLALPVMLLISQLGVKTTEAVYARRANLASYPEGIPKIAWVAMGMQENDEGGIACGWYNSYNWNVYEENDFDREATSAACREDLKDSLRRFARQPRSALQYFYKKYTSQWNAPTFQVLITNEWGIRKTGNDSKLVEWLMHGKGHDLLYEWMNAYHFLVFFFVGIYFVHLFCGKDRTGDLCWNYPAALVLLCIFGGLLFHMLWEAQARYVLGYFLLLLPFASAGAGTAACRLLAFTEKKQRSRDKRGKDL